MNREDIIEILQASMLWLDCGEPTEYGVKPEVADIGKKLIKYLQSIKLEECK